MSVDFELRLVDSAGASARNMAAALKAVETNATKAQAALNKVAAKQQAAMSFTKDIHKVEANMKKLSADPSGYIKMVRAQKELAEQRAKLNKQAGTFKGGLGEKLQEHLGFGKLAGAAAVGSVIGAGIMKGAEFLIESAKEVVSLIGEGFKEAVGASAKSQVIDLGAKLSLGKHGGEAFMKDLERFQGMTGFDDDVIAKMLLPLRRAGIDQQGSRNALAAALDIAAGEGQGGDEGRVSGILDTLKNIRLKGGVTKKMLPALGVDVKEFYADLAKQLGVSSETAEKRATEGKIDPNQLLNAIYGQVEKRQGGQLGTGAVEYSKTVESKLKKLSELPEQYFKKMASSPAFAKLGEAFGRILERLNPEGADGQRIIAKLESMFSQIVSWVEKIATPEGMDFLVNGLSAALDAAKGLVSAVESIGRVMKSAIDIAYKLAEPMAKILEISNKLTGKDTPEQEAYNDAKYKFMSGKASASDAVAGLGLGGAPAVAMGGGKGNVSVTVKQEINVPAGIARDDMGAIKTAVANGGQEAAKHLERAANEAGAHG